MGPWSIAKVISHLSNNDYCSDVYLTTRFHVAVRSSTAQITGEVKMG